MTKLRHERTRRGQHAQTIGGRHAHSFRTLLGVGVAVALVLVILEWLSFNSPHNIPLRSYYILWAHFDVADGGADNLAPTYDVRIAGRYVGQVLDPHVSDGQGIVELQLSPSIAPLRSDTTLQVRPVSLLGVRFFELYPGTKGHFLKSGSTIPATQTSSTVQLDTVLDTLDAPRRAEAQTVIHELGAGLLGRGPSINGFLADAPTMLRRLQQALSAVNARPGAVQGFITGTQQAAAAADPVREQIRTGFAPEATAIGAFSEHARSLQATLDVAPAALRTAQTELSRTDPLLEQVQRLAQAAAPVLRAAPLGLSATTVMLQQGGPDLRAADNTLRLADRAATPARTLLNTLRPILPTVDQTLVDGLPIFDQLDPRGCDIANWAGNWRSMLGAGLPGEGGAIGPVDVLRTEEEADITSVMGLPKDPLTQTDPYPAPCRAATE
jgi:ABC-type transporter Mla subunit MlaD